MTSSAGSAADRLRALPSVERLAGTLEGAPHALAVRAARAALSAARAAVEAGAEPPPLELAAAKELERLGAPSLRPVLNATGVVVHTNLGRSPLADEAVAAIGEVAGRYSNLELDLEAGGRGSRQAHVEALLCELTGGEAALAVNNCAAAVLLAAAALAGGRELVVSRGQLIEIGGSFRIPEVVTQSGARLVEVGTTNRTRRADYERAIGPETGAVLRAHPSNFRALGFVEDVAVEELCALGVPVIDDAGSGVLSHWLPALDEEPAVRRSVAAGCALVCFSGDKLLGGPQAGLIVGRAGAVAACREHPLARALRVDKLSLAALEATLRLYRDPEAAVRAVPVLRMLASDEATLAARAERLRAALSAAGVSAEPMRAAGRVGGGALPLLELEGPVCAVDPGERGADALTRTLRRGDPALVARVREGQLLLDPRTLSDEEIEPAAGAVAAALAG